MDPAIKTFDYKFIIRIDRIREISLRYLAEARVKNPEVSFDAIRLAERRLASSLACLGYSSQFAGETQVCVTLTLQEFPAGYYWFDRDLGAAIVASVMAHYCHGRKKKVALWRRVADFVCNNIKYAAEHPEIVV